MKKHHNIAPVSALKAFTIVELVVVIVAIGILAAIVVVAYNGITRSAQEVSIKSDLTNTSSSIAADRIRSGVFPSTLNSSTKVESEGNTLTYTGTVTTYCLSGTTEEAGGPIFHITQEGKVTAGDCPVTWVALGAGCCNSLGVTSRGELYGWGNNNVSQLGNNQTSNQSGPIRINGGALAGKRIVDADIGNNSIALDSEGIVYGWGSNTNGAVGDNSTTFRQAPVQVNMASFGGKTVTKVQVGNGNSFALTQDGAVYSWGRGSTGAPGNGTTSNRSAPTAVPAGSFANKKIVSISMQFENFLALAEDGTVYAWGLNNFGQSGAGTTTQINTPAMINTSHFSGKKIIQIAAGESYSLALAEDGSMFGWGINSSAQLGDGTTTSRTTPVVISTAGFDSQVRFVSAGGNSSHAITSNGTLYGWGRNVSGAVGAGSDNVLSPILVNSGSLTGKKASLVSAGGSRMHVIDTGGALHSSGDDYWGQLGDGSPNTNQLVPVLVGAPPAS